MTIRLYTSITDFKVQEWLHYKLYIYLKINLINLMREGQDQGNYDRKIQLKFGNK